MSIDSGTSSTDAYVFKPSTCASFGLIGTTVYPCRRNARNARLPNFRRSHDAPMTATTLPIWKDLTWIEDPVWIERSFDALHQRDFLGRQLQLKVGCLREPDTVLTADRSFERDDPFEQAAHGALAALHRAFLGDHDIDVDVPIPCMTERGNRQPAFLPNLFDERKELRDSAARDDDVVVELDARDFSERGRQFSPKVPDVVAVCLSRGPFQDRRIRRMAGVFNEQNLWRN